MSAGGSTSRLAFASAALVAAAACAGAATAAPARYRVQPGDSLTAIAVRYGTTVAALARLNGLSAGGVLLAGSVLRLPGATTTYVVRPGDSLTSIAIRHGVSLGALADLNRLRLEDVLPIGKRLVLPTNALSSTLDTYPRSTVRGSIVYWSNHYGVDSHLVAALAWMESGFNNEMVSPAGAVGVMQITPDTWDYVEQVLLLGRAVPHGADGNVRIGVAYLHHLLHVFGGDERQALAAYYQGARALQDAGFLPGTKQYVDDIIALKARF